MDRRIQRLELETLCVGNLDLDEKVPYLVLALEMRKIARVPNCRYGAIWRASYENGSGQNFAVYNPNVATVASRCRNTYRTTHQYSRCQRHYFAS